MIRLCAQGDILIERIADCPVSGQVIEAAEENAVTIAEGEATGHRHTLHGAVTMYRDDALARDIPAGLYVAHVQVKSTSRLQHEEHAAITLEPGTYRVRRQRQLEPADVGFREDREYSSTIED